MRMGLVFDRWSLSFCRIVSLLEDPVLVLG